MLAAYVSGHGWGHATRTAEVLRVVRERAPGLPIVVTTDAPAFLFERVIAPPLAVRAVRTDVGLVQRDALVIDEPASLAAWRDFTASWDERVAAEARWLAEAGAGIVLGDIPPLAFAAAKAAGVAAVALGNFSWDWIYATSPGGMRPSPRRRSGPGPRTAPRRCCCACLSRETSRRFRRSKASRSSRGGPGSTRPKLGDASRWTSDRRFCCHSAGSASRA